MEHFDPFLDYVRTMLLVLGSWPGSNNMAVNISNQFDTDTETARNIVNSRVVIIPHTEALTLLNKTMNEEESAIYERFKANELLGKEPGTGKEGEVE